MLRNQVHTNGKGAKKNPLVKNNIVYFIKYHDVVDDDQIILSANFFTREFSLVTVECCSIGGKGVK